MRWRIVEKRNTENPWKFTIQRQMDNSSPWQVLGIERTYVKAERLLCSIAWRERETGEIQGSAVQ